MLAGADPDEVAEGLWALREALETSICFYTFEGTERGPPSSPTSSPRPAATSRRRPAFASAQPMAYLIAPPIEAMIGLDAALKAADVTLAKFFGPPTETNFAGGYLTGELADVEAAADAFTDAVAAVVRSPLGGLNRPSRERR